MVMASTFYIHTYKRAGVQACGRAGVQACERRQKRIEAWSNKRERAWSIQRAGLEWQSYKARLL